mmetsp:Transcript_57065/g.92899  ORF Transcript_57065/g.92899 Transcript_57065/m.92899 type:complete len:208 (-) Transcript_57065:400-1023(-)
MDGLFCQRHRDSFPVLVELLQLFLPLLALCKHLLQDQLGIYLQAFNLRMPHLAPGIDVLPLRLQLIEELLLLEDIIFLLLATQPQFQEVFLPLVAFQFLLPPIHSSWQLPWVAQSQTRVAHVQQEGEEVAGRFCLHDDVGSVLQEFWFEAILMHLFSTDPGAIEAGVHKFHCPRLADPSDLTMPGGDRLVGQPHRAGLFTKGDPLVR